jgi:hypothetical protein
MKCFRKIAQRSSKYAPCCKNQLGLAAVGLVLQISFLTRATESRKNINVPSNHKVMATLIFGLS